MSLRGGIVAIIALGCGAAARAHAQAPDTELVVAHFKEDLSWAARWNTSGVRLRVYTKGDVPISVEAERLPNVGRESHTYLSHIVNNYDALAKWTVFTQGAAPTWGYRHGDSTSGHLTDEIELEHYMEPFHGGQDSFFALSTVAHLPSGIQSTRLGMLTDSLKSVSNALCPASGPDGWSAWWVDESHPHRKAGREMLAFYHRYVLQNDATTSAALAPITLAFVQGARFAVSRERILKRPRAYYEALLARVSKARDPLEGFFLEAMWHDIFHPERVQAAAPLCEYMPLPKNLAAMSYVEMFEDTAQRLTAKDMVSGYFDTRQLSDAYNPEVTVETTAETTAEMAGETSAAPSGETSAATEESTTEEPSPITHTLVATGNFSLEVENEADKELLTSSAGLLGAAEALAGQAGVTSSSVVVTVADGSRRRLQAGSNVTVHLDFNITLRGSVGQLPTAEDMRATLTTDSFATSFAASLNTVLAQKLGEGFGGVLSVASFAVASISVTDGAGPNGGNTTDGDGGSIESFAAGRRGMTCLAGLWAAALALSA